VQIKVKWFTVHGSTVKKDNMFTVHGWREMRISPFEKG
jgi:hypothetical protein